MARPLSDEDRAELIALLTEFRKDWAPGMTVSQITLKFGAEDGILAARIDRMLSRLDTPTEPADQAVREAA